MKKLLTIITVFLGLFFINNPFVHAKENIEIKSIRVIEHSDTATIEELDYENNIITPKIAFNKLNDFVTLAIDLENTTSKNIILDSITNSIDTDHLTIESDSINDTLEKNSNKTIKVKIKYDKELINHEDINLTNGTIEFAFKEPSLLSNPLTRSGITIILLVLFMVLIATYLSRTKKSKALLLLLFLIPTFVYAANNYNIKIEFSDITIKARNLQYRVTINTGADTPEEISVTYGEPIGELPEAPKPGYTQTGWVNQESQPVTPETIIQDELTITPTYEIINYNITYNLNDGLLETENPTNYTVEDEVTLKNPTKTGYTFRGWSTDGGQTYQTEYTISKGTTGDLNIVAYFSANQDTLYKVIHRKMDMNGEYKVEETEELHGATDTEVTPQRKNYPGFIQPDPQTKSINGDGTTKFTYDYEREKYNFTITDRTDLDSSTTANGEYYYDTEITLKAKEKVGYDFAWSDGDTNLTRTFKLTGPTTLTPVYTAKTNIPYKVIHKTMNIDGETYTVRDEITNYGTTNTEVTPSTNTYEGFKKPSTKTVTIKGDGSTEVEYLYERLKYNFTIEDSEYVESNKSSGKYFYGTTINLKAIDRERYIFEKWSNNNTNQEITIELREDLTIKPIYQLEGLRVTFNPNGGTVDPESITVQENNSIEELPTPERENYIFQGWYTDVSGGISVDENYKPTTDIEIYARWTKSVVFAEFSNSPISIFVGENETIDITNTVDLGETYTFSSEDTSIATVNQNGEVTGVSRGETNIILTGATSGLSKGIHVYVSITSESVITFNTNGGKFGDKTTTNTLTYREMIKYSHTTNVDDTGKKLSNYGTNWTNSNITGSDRGSSTGAHIITIPGAKSLTIDIYYNGESTSYDWATVWTGAYSWYTASGYYTNSNVVSGADKLGGSQSGTYTVNGNTLTYMGHKTLTINDSSVTFGFKSDSGGYGKGYGYYAIIRGIGYEGEYKEPVKGDAGFMGWYKDPNNSNQQPVEAGMNLGDITLYAKYGYNIKYNANGGSIDSSQAMAEIEKPIGQLPVPTRQGYSFDGWYTELIGGTRINSEYIPNSNMTLYARWVENSGCTYEGELVQGAEFVKGQYTYRYKQQTNSNGNWSNSEDDGWGVQLTDNTSTDPVNSTLCSSINDKPLVSTSYMFRYSNASSIDTSSFDTSTVKNMEGMFLSCYNITSLNLSTFNTKNVTNMKSMFSYIPNLKTIDLSSFDTTNVTDMNNMFYSCNKLEELDLTNFNTSNVTNMSGIFGSSSKLKTIYASEDFTTNSLTNTTGLFSDNYELVGGAGTLFDSNYTTASYAHIDEGADNPGYFSNRKPIKVEFNPTGGTVIHKNRYYNSGEKIGELPLPERKNYVFLGWFTAEENGTMIDENQVVSNNITYYAHWIEHSKKTITFDVNGGKGENTTKEVYNDQPVGNLPTALRDDYVFEGWFTEIEGGIEITSSTYITSNITVYAHWSVGLSCTFDGELVPGAEYVNGQYRYKYKQHYSINGWQDMEEDGWGVAVAEYNYETVNTAPCTMINDKPLISMQNMFGSTSTYNFDLSEFNTHNIIDMSYMFSSAYNTKKLDISNFDTSNVKDMSYMFRYDSYLEEINMSNLDFSNVSNATDMFNGLSSYYFKKLTMDNINANDLMNNGSFRFGGVFNNANIPYLSVKNWIIPEKFEHWLGRTWQANLIEEIDTTGWDLSSTKSLYGVFADSTNLVKIDGMETWNTSNVENISQMFHGLKNLDFFDVSHFDTSNVIDISNMFYNCEKLIDIDLSNFNTSKVRKLYTMFNGCKNLQRINLDGWDLSNNTIYDGGGFFGNAPVKYVSAKNWKLPEEFQNWISRTWASSSVETIDVTGWDLSKTKNITGLFGDSTHLKTIVGLNTWNTSNLETVSNMFSNCISLTNIDISNWELSNLKDSSTMFASCSNLEEIVLPIKRPSKINTMSSMFAACTKLKTIYASDEYTNLDLTDINAVGMFYDTPSLVGGAGTVYSSTDVSGPYAHIDEGTSNPGYYTAIGNAVVTFNPNGGSVMNNTKKVNLNSAIGSLPTPEKRGYTFKGWYTSLESGILVDENTIVNSPTTVYAHWSKGIECTFEGDLFPGYEYVNGQYTYRYMQENTQISGWSNIDEDGWGVAVTDRSSTAAVTSDLCSSINGKPIVSMAWMFYNSPAIAIDTSTFDTSNVTNMESMFWTNGPTKLDVSNFDTSKVTNMGYMFENTRAYELDLSNFNTSNVKSMLYMFAYDKNLRELDVSSFDTSNVQNMMSMFESIEKVEELDLSNFNTSNVTEMINMFEYSKSLKTLNIENFDTSNVISMFAMFRDTSSLTELDLSHFDTSNLRDMSNMFSGTSNLKELDISNFNTSKLEDMSTAFSGCGVEHLNLRNFDTSNVTDMGYLFSSSKAKEIDLRNWDTSKVTDMYNMFHSCNNIEKIYVSDKFTTQNITDSITIFGNNTKLVGGAGTTYDSNHTNKLYARIDEGETNPGYFTEKEPGTIELTFDPNVEGIESKKTYIVQNETIGYIPTFYRDGYRVSGWYKNPDGTEKITTKSTVNENQTFYAQWEELVPYVITLDSNGGASVENKIIYAAREGMLLEIGALPTPTRENYTFDGWYTGLTDGYKVSTTSYFRGNMTLYARWKLNVALLAEGYTFNGNIKKISNTGQSYVSSYTKDKKVKSIVYTNTLKSGFSPTSTNTISDSTSKYPIYIWWESSTGTIYVYCASNTIYANSYAYDMFIDFRALQTAPVIEHIDFSNATSCRDMFQYAGYDATTFNIDASSMNISNCNSTEGMFRYSGRNSPTWSVGDLSNWNMSKVISTSYMFEEAGYSASSWGIGNISNWNTEKVYEMKSMFKNAGHNATTWTDLGTLLVDGKTNSVSLDNMFEECPAAKGTLYIKMNPTSYKDTFKNGITKSGSQITLNYAREVNTIDKIVSSVPTTSNVVKGSLIEQ